MADYSYNEIMKMQNDAIRRVNEMQKRAKFVVEEANEEEKIHGKEKTVEVNNNNTIKRVKMPNDYLDELKGFASTSSYFEKEEEVKKAVKGNKEQKEERKEYTGKTQNINQNDFFKNILDDLNLDSDKALILSLILLLAEEKADEMLILALLYILS
ncbi:MAG: hypothetical protein E7557_08530 [Ruminococcaceae bacterium]|nr:hypothetical protein [Oscillospiraceae bacterium]